MGADRSWFEIKEHELEREWVKQAERMHEICMDLADAKLAYNEAKNALEVVKAEQARDARLHPAKHGIEKVTVDAVSDAVTVSGPVEAAEKELIQAKHDVDVLEAAVTAMEHKKRALESLVQLHGMGYFAEPRAPLEVQKQIKTDATFGADRRKTLRHQPTKR